MEDVLTSSKRVPRELLRELLIRRDGPGLARMIVTLTLLIAAGATTCALAAAGSPAYLAAAAIGGLALVSYFPTLHECGHGTAFRSPALNALGVWIGAPLMLQAPSFFREFHWAHHRQTQDPQHDPEIASAPQLLDDWPTNVFTYLALASGQALWLGKLGFTLACALLPAAVWRPMFPFVRATQARRVARESRLVTALWLGLVAAGLAWVPGFWALLLLWPIAHLFMGLYVMAEHTGLPHDGSQLHRTRTVRSSAALRWWMWNMPYHAEHHAYPAVPFHALPALHRALEPELEHTSRGYLAFHAEALRRALRRTRS